MELIGLSGFARVGKDSAAAVLVEEFGFTRIAFADKLRDFLYTLNPVVWSWDLKDERSERPLQDVINSFGWNGYKDSIYSDEIRRLLQILGTDCGREQLYENVWVDACLSDLKNDGKYVVTDVRFPNEMYAIKERGGTVWRVTRHGVGPANDHSSENALTGRLFDNAILNNGDLDGLAKIVRLVYAESKVSTNVV